MKEITLQFGPQNKNITVGKVIDVAKEVPLKLDCGVQLYHIPLAYQMYGELNADKSNAVLVCHGLSGDQYAASSHPVTGKSGWWERMIGPGKPLDTERYCIISSNVLGGCLGSLGPKCINPDTKLPYNLDFPVITMEDMARAQKLLLDALGISTLFAMVGGSMGGMLTLAMASLYPKLAHAYVPIACAARHTTQNIAFHEIGRQAIMADPDWQEGNYIQARSFPARGLAVARMTAHVTYLSKSGLHRKFGRQLQDREQVAYGFDADFKVESYLRYQGKSFVERFDPNSYLYITRAMDYFDLYKRFDGDLRAAFADVSGAFCLLSFSSDWLYPTEEAKHVVRALAASAKEVSFVEIQTDKGHDAFLLDEPEFYEAVRGFIAKKAREHDIA